MTESIVILTETTLTERDHAVLADLLSGTEYQASVLVPANTERHLLMDFVERLSLLEIAEAFKGLGDGKPDLAQERAKAQDVLDASVAAISDLFTTVTSRVVDENESVSALVSTVHETKASQAVVFTEPHSVLDTFHTDIATRAQDELGLPVLHVYAGSGFIGES